MQRIVDRGLLQEIREKPTGKCRVWYDADEVAALAKTYKPTRSPSKVAAERRMMAQNARGAQAAKAFALFTQGKTDVEVVIAAELDPLLVAELREEWHLLQHPELLRAKKLREKAEREEKERERWELNEARQEKWRIWKLRMAQVERKTA